MLGHDLGVTKKDIRDALTRLSEDLDTRAAEMSEVASGWRIQVRRDYAEWVARLYQEKPPRLSRALLETLARSEAHTSELPSLMRISYAVFCLTKENNHTSD